MRGSLPVDGRALEKRREKSRNAAKYRREKENSLFTSLCDLIPICANEESVHVDRIASLRIAAAFSRSREAARRVFSEPIASVFPSAVPKYSLALENELTQCIDGFGFIIDNNGLVVYVSLGVTPVLGLSQMDLMGYNIFDFIHKDDVELLKDGITKSENQNTTDTNKSLSTEYPLLELTLRVKSIITARGRNLNLKSAIYKVAPFTLTKLPALPVLDITSLAAAGGVSGGCLSPLDPEVDSCGEDFDDNASEATFVGRKGVATPSCHQRASVSTAFYGLFGSPIPYPTNLERLNEQYAYNSRHSMDMKFTFCHQEVTELLGYDLRTLTGMSFFSLIHADDLQSVKLSFNSLIRQGQAVLGPYRILIRGDGLRWMRSECSIVTHNTRGNKGQYIVCTHLVATSETKPDVEGITLATCQGRISKPARETTSTRKSSIKHAASKRVVRCKQEPVDPGYNIVCTGSICDVNKSNKNNTKQTEEIIQVTTKESCEAIDFDATVEIQNDDLSLSSVGFEEQMQTLQTQVEIAKVDDIVKALSDSDCQAQQSTSAIVLQPQQIPMLQPVNTAVPTVPVGHQLAPLTTESNMGAGSNRCNDFSQAKDLAALAPFVGRDDFQELNCLPLEPFDLDLALDFDFDDALLAEPSAELSALLNQKPLQLQHVKRAPCGDKRYDEQQPLPVLDDTVTNLLNDVHLLQQHGSTNLSQSFGPGFYAGQVSNASAVGEQQKCTSQIPPALASVNAPSQGMGQWDYLVKCCAPQLMSRDCGAKVTPFPTSRQQLDFSVDAVYSGTEPAYPFRISPYHRI